MRGGTIRANQEDLMVLIVPTDVTQAEWDPVTQEPSGLLTAGNHNQSCADVMSEDLSVTSLHLLIY